MRPSRKCELRAHSRPPVSGHSRFGRLQVRDALPGGLLRELARIDAELLVQRRVPLVVDLGRQLIERLLGPLRFALLLQLVDHELLVQLHDTLPFVARAASPVRCPDGRVWNVEECSTGRGFVRM